MADEEPTTADAIDGWIRDHLTASDEHAAVAEATEEHRLEHGCDAYAGGDGPLLQVIAAAVRPTRVLEIGTGLGYSALHLASGAGPDATVDTIEHDPGHAALARRHFEGAGAGARVTVHQGVDLDLLPTLAPGYDLVVYDAAIPTPAHLDVFERVLAPTGALVTSNLFLGRHIPHDPRLPDGAAYRERLFDGTWRTAFLGGKALSVRRRG